MNSFTDNHQEHPPTFSRLSNSFFSSWYSVNLFFYESKLLDLRSGKFHKAVKSNTTICRNNFMQRISLISNLLETKSILKLQVRTMLCTGVSSTATFVICLVAILLLKTPVSRLTCSGVLQSSAWVLITVHVNRKQLHFVLFFDAITLIKVFRFCILFQHTKLLSW